MYHFQAAEKGEVFDLIFMDADKEGQIGDFSIRNFLAYYNKIFDAGLLAKAGVLLVDNTLW